MNKEKKKQVVKGTNLYSLDSGYSMKTSQLITNVIVSCKVIVFFDCLF